MDVQFVSEILCYKTHSNLLRITVLLTTIESKKSLCVKTVQLLPQTGDAFIVFQYFKTHGEKISLVFAMLQRIIMQHYMCHPMHPVHQVKNKHHHDKQNSTDSHCSECSGTLIRALLMQQLRKETCGSHFTSLSITVLFFFCIRFQQRNPISVSMPVKGRPAT